MDVRAILECGGVIAFLEWLSELFGNENGKGALILKGFLLKNGVPNAPIGKCEFRYSSRNMKYLILLYLLVSSSTPMRGNLCDW